MTDQLTRLEPSQLSQGHPVEPAEDVCWHVFVQVDDAAGVFCNRGQLAETIWTNPADETVARRFVARDLPLSFIRQFGQ